MDFQAFTPHYSSAGVNKCGVFQKDTCDVQLGFKHDRADTLALNECLTWLNISCRERQK